MGQRVDVARARRLAHAARRQLVCGLPPAERRDDADLAIDLWEHAWVLDYPGGRDAYVRALLAHAVDWAAVSDALVAAANGAPESAKLRHLVSLSAADMKKLRSVVIDHGTLDLSEDLSLSKLHLLGAAEPAADGAGAAVRGRRGRARRPRRRSPRADAAAKS